MKHKKHWQIITLSGRTLGELQEVITECELITSYNEDKSLQELANQINDNNKHYYYRLAFVVDTIEEFKKQMQFRKFDFAAKDEQDINPKLITFLFSGGGVQYAGMGKHLYETEIIFRKNINYYDQILKPILSISLLDILYPTELNRAVINQINYAQPAIFAFELALVKLWQHWGIQPDIVMGHSLGEFAAACVAGVFSEEDGLMLTAERGCLMQQLSDDTLMMVIFAGLEEVQKVICEFDKVSIAAENGLMNTVISGPAFETREACKIFECSGIAIHQLNIARAGHSEAMLPMIDMFRKILQLVPMRSPKIKVVSNLTGEIITNQIATADYWCLHTLNKVKFKSGMETLAKLNTNCFIEISPQPALLSMAQKCLEPQIEHRLWLPSLHDKEDTIEQLFQNLAMLYVNRFKINWPKQIAATEFLL